MLYLELNFNKLKLQGLLDSGSALNIIGANVHLDIVKEGFLLEKCDSFSVTSANGQKSLCIGAVRLPITIKNITKFCMFYVFPGIEIPIILGIDIWKKFNLIPSELQFLHTSDSSNLHTCRIVEPVISDYEYLSAEQRLIADNIIEQFKEITTEKIGLGRTDLVVHHIDTGDSMPIKQRMYRLPPPKLDALNEEVDRMLALGVIEPCISPWNSPVLMIPKKDGTSRFCLDSRKLNSVTKKFAYGLPFISDILDSLGSSKFLSSIDLSSAFWQVPLSESSRLKTAFTVPYRNTYCFTVTAFGTSNGPSMLQSLMDTLLGPAFERKVFVYLDDIIVTGSSFEEHASLLMRVLDRLKYGKLSINFDKCQFFRSELKYLGHVVDRFGLRVDPAKVQAITAFPTPKSKKEVRRFLGMASWYRRFVENFATRAAPLTKLTATKTGTPRFAWNAEAEIAFNDLKVAISSAPVLSCPDYSKPFRVYTDASSYGTGGVLTQGDGEDEKPVAFMSKTLSAAEKNFSACEREALAVLHAVENWRCYLDTGEEFEVVTDHSALRWFMGIETPTGRLARWGVRLSPFNFKIIHRKGSEQVVPDALSRAPITAAITASETKDTWFKQRFNSVRDNPQSHTNMCIIDGKLYRHSKADAEPDPDFIWKQVVMKEDQERLLKFYHDEPTAGHLGIFKTYHRLRQSYYWPALYQSVVKYVSNCETCLATKHTTSAPLGLMTTPKRCSRPFEFIAMDVHGPLTMTKNKHRYILLVTCCFSKYCVVIPLKDANSTSMIPLIRERVFLIHGIPRVVLSDNGKVFISKEMKKFFSDYKIPTIFNTPYYTPQINTVERYNRTLNSMLIAFAHKNQRTWDTHLSELQFALNAARSEASGYSPNFLVFGREIVVSGEVYAAMSPVETQEVLLSPDEDDRLERFGSSGKDF